MRNEFLREEFAESVLVVCPTSLKYQWKKKTEEITGETGGGS
jgi:SNF2 family DNA or RNA helicase